MDRAPIDPSRLDVGGLEIDYLPFAGLVLPDSDESEIVGCGMAGGFGGYCCDAAR